MRFLKLLLISLLARRSNDNSMIEGYPPTTPTKELEEGSKMPPYIPDKTINDTTTTEPTLIPIPEKLPTTQTIKITQNWQEAQENANTIINSIKGARNLFKNTNDHLFTSINHYISQIEHNFNLIDDYEELTEMANMKLDDQDCGKNQGVYLFRGLCNLLLGNIDKSLMDIQLEEENSDNNSKSSIFTIMTDFKKNEKLLGYETMRYLVNIAADNKEAANDNLNKMNNLSANIDESQNYQTIQTIALSISIGLTYLRHRQKNAQIGTDNSKKSKKDDDKKPKSTIRNQNNKKAKKIKKNTIKSAEL